MVKITGTHRVTIDRLQIINSEDVPGISMDLVETTISEAALGGTAVTINLSSSLGTALLVPFGVTGTATRGQDYELRVGPASNDALIADDEFRVIAGHESAAIYVTPKTVDAAVEGVETVIITLTAVLEDAEYTVGTLDDHTVNIQDASTTVDAIVAFATGSVSVLEGGATTTTSLQVTVQLMRDADGDETTTFTVGGTASGSGVDYTQVTSSPLTWAEGQTEQDIEYTIIGNDAVTTNRTIITTLTGGSNVTVGTLAIHTTTIVDDDAVILVPRVAWRDTAVDVEEGAGQVSFPIDCTTGIPAAGGIFLTVTVATSTADPNNDYVLGVQTPHIPQGSLTVPLVIGFPVNLTSSLDTELVIVLSVADGSGALISGSDTLTVSIKNSLSSEQPIDGILLAYDNAPLAPERVQFDKDSPDLQMFTDGCEVMGNAGATAAFHAVSSSDHNGQAVMDLVLLHADAQWALNNPLEVRADVLMGEEHNPVLIRCYDRDYANTLTEQLGGAATSKQLTVNSGSGDSWSENQTDCLNGSTAISPCVRDVIFYGYDLSDPVLFAGIRFDHTAGLVDNFRMENLRCRPKSFVKSPFFVSREVTNGTAQGKIKFYDCSGRNYAKEDGTGLGWGNSSHPRASKWGLRAECRANWDIRVQLGAPYPFADSNEEHYIYVDSPVGDVTYPALKVTAIAKGLTECGNYFMGVKGLEGANTEPPGRTAIQIASRATSNPGDAGSGDLTFVNCAGRNVGSEIISGGQGFSIWGHNGRVYFKDCEYTLSAPYTQSLGGLGILSEQSWASGDSLPHGSYAYQGDEGLGYIYSVKNVVVDGFTYIVASQGNGSRAAMKFFGVEHVKLVKFDLQNGSGSSQINMNSNGFPGLGFTAQFDIDDLVYPDSHAQAGEAYAGAFSAYPGWGGLPKIHDGYFMNWYGDTSTSGDGAVDLGTGSIDDYDSVIVPAQLANRLTTASLAGTKWVTVDGHDATPNPQDFPNPRMITGTTYFADIVNETHQVRVDMKYAFMNVLKIYHRDTGSYPGTYSWDTGHSSPVTLTPPQLVGDAWKAANAGDSEPLSYIDLGLTIDVIAASSPTASTTIVVELDDGVVNTEGRYNFPQEATPSTWVDVPGVAPLTHTVNVVPVGGMWTAEFELSSSVSAYPNQNEFNVEIVVHRENLNSNTDGDKFAVTFTVSGVFAGRCSAGVFYDYVLQSNGTYLYEAASTFIIPAGDATKSIWVGGFTTNQNDLQGTATVTMAVPIPNTYAQLGATPVHLLTMNSFG
ncbi:MAG: hypothetical protein OSB57_04150 [Planctomycetota bacterium]|nr:hypothetical protein [Planctomycetota bacterium]